MTPRHSRRTGALLLLGLLALSSVAGAEAPVSVSVDASAAGAPLERVWPYYGYDEINYTTTPEGEALLRELVALHSAPVHVRSQFLLNTGDGAPAMKWGSTNVYTEDTSGNPNYSWPLIDGIMDAITGAGAAPFVELGFMPEALSSHPMPYRNSSTTLLDGGCFYPPKDYAKWGDLIRTWATHANERYPNVATDWQWELWNEPDLGYWRGSFDDYAKLYDFTEAALHEAIPDAALGGPAVAGPGSAFLKRFLQHCASGSNALTGHAGTRLDLVSFHAKGGVSIAEGRIQMDLGNQLRLHRTGFEAVAAFPQYKQTPIYITEADPDGCAACPASTFPADAYRNSTAYGAYELAVMKHSLELEAELGVKLGGVLTWAFTFPGTAYFAGYRVLATNGIDLPVLSAFKLLGRLDGTRLPLTSSGALKLDDILMNGVRDQPEIDGLATQNGAAIQVLLWNYHDVIASVTTTPVHLTIHLPDGFGPYARISHLRADELHGDAYTVWRAQGAPASPSAAQIADLQRAMEPSSFVPDRTVAIGESRSVELDFDLPRFGVSLLTISPALDASDGGSSATPLTPHGGCACRLCAAQADPSEPQAMLGLGVLLLVTFARRRLVRTQPTRVADARTVPASSEFS
jgi:xylan 1,4-beta-xylosidase